MEALTTTKPTAIEIRSNAAQFPRLHSLEASRAVDEIAKAITTAAFYNGNSIEQREAELTAAALRIELLENPQAIAAGCKSITTTEIATIIKAAVLRKPEFRNMNVADLFREIVDWSLNEGAAIQEQARQRYREQNPNPLQHLCEAWGQKMIKTNQ